MQIPNADLDWTGSGLPRSSRFDDVYFSRDDEIAESKHVFLNGNDLASRWQEIHEQPAPCCFTIGELGLGCGLNLLLTWQLWRQCQSPTGPARLHYIAFEQYPPRRQDLQRLHQRWPDLQTLSQRFLQLYPDHSAGCHRIWLDEDVLLDIHYGDATESLAGLLPGVDGQVDCWFADGFSPSRNPGLWQDKLWQLLARASASAASLSTYSVAGQVRRGLQAAGFNPERRPGHGQKRHMLVARRGDPREPAPADAEPWFQLPAATTRTAPGARSALVVGAGLAGSCMAHSLARRGWQVTVLEAGPGILSGASGCGQLNLRCHLIGEDSPLARFYLHSFLYARRLFSALSQAELPMGEPPRFWFDCGLVQLRSSLGMADSSRLSAHMDRLAFLYGDAILRRASAAELGELAGVAVREDGLYLPLGGFVQPELLCSALLAHPGITVHTHSPVTGFHYQDHNWQLLSPAASYCAPVAILCASAALRHWPQTAALPMQVIRGQNTLVQASADSTKLRTVVTGQRTLFPPVAGQQTISATYDRHSEAITPRADDDAENLQRLDSSFLGHPPVGNQIMASRVGLRSNSLDHAPLIGPVPDLPAMAHNYAELARDASTPFSTPGTYLPGLYVSAAHGSSGLATSALAAEYLASLVCAELPPLDRATRDCLNPARFLIRDLKKQRHN